MKMCKWDSFEIETYGRKYPVSLDKDEKSIGFLLIFDKYEEALEYAKNPELVKEIKES